MTETVAQATPSATDPDARAYRLLDLRNRAQSAMWAVLNSPSEADRHAARDRYRGLQAEIRAVEDELAEAAAAEPEPYDDAACA